MKLNIGCGLKKPEGFVNIDGDPDVLPDVLCDLTTPWPFDDGSMTGGICHHVMEHLPGQGFYKFVQELYRVSAPGAVTECVVPHPRHDIFLRDPTHVRPVLPETMLYFSKSQSKGLTPLWKTFGVDFLVERAIYVIDPGLTPGMRAEIEKNFRFFEQHYCNVIFEVHFNITAVK